ncbi:RCC1 domain-containing protein [Aspergillus lucknowensis]|uniref:Regulator of chromosome condensation 1/beta-lactamase-inhibitor protein II n=1 Tax=Aspergillus lucknowensis TaxID=176173 RepID=A0ABR4M703_9EURO
MTPLPTLFAFGSNGSGQLGIGHGEDVSIPTRCIFDDDYDGEVPDAFPSGKSRTQEHSGGDCVRVSRIVAGGNHTLVLLEDGRVYAAGWNRDGRCGWLVKTGPSSSLNSSSEGQTGSMFSFKRVVVIDEGAGTGRTYDLFKSVSATWEGTFLVPLACTVDKHSFGDDHGDAVFVLGSGAKGELGLGPDTLRTSAAKRIPNFPPPGTRIRTITSGMGHTVVVLTNGDVYGWGGARKGQIGEAVASGKIVWSPVKIEGLPFPVSDATCGREFTVLCGDSTAGEFVVLGSSLGDKWGVISGVPNSDRLSGYLKIDASWHGVYVHQKDGSVLAWGRNDRGQLPAEDFSGVKEVAVGSEHVLALLEDQNVVAFGWGEHGNCGSDTDAQGNVKSVHSQITLPEGSSKVVGVGAGCATSWIIAS